MGEIIEIHPANPQSRLIAEAARVLEKGGVAIYPTDSGYALGCLLEQKDALERIRQIRQLDKDHLFTLLCRDLSHISNYAQINNPLFRYLKAHTPGPFTFLLKATKEVPKRLLHPKRRTIGIRVPDNQVVQDLLSALSQPLMSVSLELSRHPESSRRHPELVSGSQLADISILIYIIPCKIEPPSLLD